MIVLSSNLMKYYRKYLCLVFFLFAGACAFNDSVCAQEALGLGGPRTLFPNQGSSHAAVGLESEQEVSETRTIDVIGRGRIYRGDVAVARNEAIKDALQGVVERAVSLVISPASVVQEFQLLSDQVYGQGETFIHDYKVLSESKSGRYYRVVVRATVSTKAIQDRLQDIGILMIHKEMPTIVLFLSEQDVGEPLPQYWWGKSPPDTDMSVTENVLSEYMREKGFVVVGREAMIGDSQINAEYMAPELSDEAAVEIGKELGADFVIVGKAVVSYSGNVLDKKTKSIEATVSTHAVRTDSGMVVASCQATRAVVNSDDRSGGREALILSASALAQDLARQILAKWHREERQPVLVELVVKGIGEYADFVRFRTHLRNDVRGVWNVYLRSIKAGEAKMDVDIMGNARILADELMLQRFENLAVNILEVSEKGINLELIPSLVPEPDIVNH